VRRHEVCAAALILSAPILAPITTLAQSAPARTPAATDIPLQLEVFINDQPSNLIAAFARTPQGGLTSTAGELRSVGLKAAGPETRTISLSDLAGVTWRYDAPGQRLYILAKDGALIPHRLDARRARARAPPQTDVGALLNYSLASQISQAAHASHWIPPGLAGNFEARGFGPLGVVSVTAESVVGGQTGAFRRLDSSWSYADPETLLVLRAGDLISGGFDWTRPVRLGGVQIQRSFALRPDLITMPTPSLSGSAVVPSMAEVVINGATVLSRPVASGPLATDNLPPVQGSSINTLVPFFATPEMLKPGLLDFSAELGFARHFYGLRSFDYNGQPVGSGSLRYGMNDWATAETHAEAGAGLALVGAGGVVRLGGFGAIDASVAASHYRQDTGFQAGVGLQTQLGPVSFGAKDQTSFSRYTDLGAVTAPGPWTVQSQAALPPRQLLQINSAIAAPQFHPWAGMGPVAGPTLGVSYSSLTPWGAAHRHVWGATVHQSLASGAGLYLTLFRSTRDAGDGFFAGLSMSFGGGRAVSVGAEGSGQGGSAYAEATQQAEQRPGGVGWRVRGEDGQTQDLEAEASYVSSVGRADVLVQRLQGANSLQGRIDGAVVLVDGRAMISDRINDAFAVVETGHAHIPVSFENRAAGETGADGRLILPYVSGYSGVNVSIDPGALPADLAVDVVRRQATPIAGAGAVVRFILKPASPGVLVTLRTTAGVFLPVGAAGWIDGDRDHPFVVGYDGQAYLENARDGGVLQLQTPEGWVCAAHIAGLGKDIHVSPCL
jgi:outer membrane usher protein